MTQKIIFMGTPDFSVPILKALANDDAYEVLAVLTQPDRPVGRKRVLTATPVKEVAVDLNLPVYQPEKLVGSEELQILIDLAPDFIITAAYGQFLPVKLLNAAKIAAINVHASLLPKYRGGAPIHYAVMNGDAQTGVTIMYMVKAMDAGDMIAQKVVNIGENTTTGEMFDELSLVGRDLLMDTLPKLVDGTSERTPQDPDQVTFAPNITPEQEVLDFNRTARELHNQVRGLNPFPTAHTTINGVRTKVQQTHLVDATTNLPAGTVVKKSKKELWIAAAEGTILAFDELQPAGKPKMAVSAYLNGHAKFDEGQQVISHE
ncbi:methionyl-tRNA formyltransferase [Weissella uvarum]|uniref:methionyl-tRNA formyltransferase n=1 Tax=Weissella uvarum TaxID=1479233 RepID=UPI00195F7E30|nr:methionyl-tRNA formyltransferase [Weissella uvarum]MBM7617768.1 methionyl-tRNA formyltransferase [Weissella uvarum]MCM0595853.1 methionyl-tRNA formyltransferase [Weissella uvarum]